MCSFRKVRPTVFAYYAKPTVTANLNQPYGLAFWKNWLYVANTDAVVRFSYKTGATSTEAKAEKIATLTEGGYNQHWTRNLLFSRDNKKLFVTVGSSCNTCEESDSQRAAISVLDPDGKNKKLYATGLRNPVGMAWQPDTNQLWTVVNERDNVGDDAPPDYFTKVNEGEFYGWPYAYTDIEGKIIRDTTFGDKNPAMVKKTVAADVPVQAHSAALGVVFYPTDNGNFPVEYRGDAFLAYHGSWNRSQKTGYKIARVNFQNGQPNGATDFVTGFLSSNGDVSGRPVDIIVAPDGSLLFSDDGGGKIWRVSYTGTN
jgi:glucose/arabinose dehydrogenase